MTYEQALAFWYAQVNFEQRAPAAGDLKLDRMRALLRALGDPHRRLPIVHIAGSKGKGSTAAMLAAVLRRAGYRTGLFTSPHLCHVEERFQIDGRPISRDELTALLAQLRDTVDASECFRDGPPTFFELATAVGFLYFVHHAVDAAVLEVGLGGRLDSTNVCLPRLAIITCISHDHTRILGDRLAQIAWEKAGIIKPGRPVVSGVGVPEAREVIERVGAERGAPLVQLGRDFRFAYHPGRMAVGGGSKPRVDVTTGERVWTGVELSLLGEHQAANAAVAIAAVEELVRQGWHISEQAVRDGLARVEWPARLEVLAAAPWVVLDCAHNVASAAALIDTLRTSFPAARRVLVFAGSADKDLAGMLRVFAPHFAHAVFTRFVHNPRALPPDELAATWTRLSAAPGEVRHDPGSAVARAREMTAPDDLLCITGSVFLAGEVRPLLVAGAS